MAGLETPALNQREMKEKADKIVDVMHLYQDGPFAQGVAVSNILKDVGVCNVDQVLSIYNYDYGVGGQMGGKYPRLSATFAGQSTDGGNYLNLYRQNKTSAERVLMGSQIVIPKCKY